MRARKALRILTGPAFGHQKLMKQRRKVVTVSQIGPQGELQSLDESNSKTNGRTLERIQ